MHRFLLATLLLTACGSSASRQPVTTIITTTTSDDVVCTDEVAPGTGITHRVCVAPVVVTHATIAANPNVVICNEEVPTGSQVSKRVCRTQVEIEDNKKVARDIWLHQGSRTGCNPELGDCSKMGY